MVSLGYLTIDSAHELLSSKKVSCVELTSYYLTRIKNLDSKIGAVLTVLEESALHLAQEVDEKIASGQTIGLLEGIPYTAKDMFLTRGVRTTAASKILDNFIAPYSATTIEKLNKAGSILIAKVNQDEFAHGGSTENSAYQITKNPFNTDYVPGGSSGGSAASVAADFGIFSLGTDTGGSIRQPAAYCGVTGLKPSYGLVSRYGVVSMASSFDCIGPITRTASDSAIVLEAIYGRDKMDSTTIDLKFEAADSAKFEGLNVGLASGFTDHPSITEAREFLQKSKYTTLDVELPNSEMALAAYYVLVPSEISSNLERYDGVRYGMYSAQAKDLKQSYTMTRSEFLGPEVKRRILTGTYALSAGYYDAYYKKAMQIRTLVSQQFSALFETCDVIMTPTTEQPAFKLGAKSDPVEMYKTDILTVSANLAGLPAISIPAGIDSQTGLPIGLQIIGRLGEDAKVLALAQDFQAQTDWHNKVKECLI